VRPARGSDVGTTAVEVVLVAPVFLAALLLVVGLGRIVEAEGRVQGAASDAARAASLARNGVLATASARDAAALNLDGRGVSCTAFDVAVDTADFRPGGLVRVSVSCTADLSGFGLVGLPGNKTLRGEATAPLEQYRGTG
jgi:Flp pilus assembly protein TadG